MIRLIVALLITCLSLSAGSILQLTPQDQALFTGMEGMVLVDLGNGLFWFGPADEAPQGLAEAPQTPWQTEDGGGILDDPPLPDRGVDMVRAPEPSSFALAGAGLAAGLLLWRRRSRAR